MPNFPAPWFLGIITWNFVQCNPSSDPSRLSIKVRRFSPTHPPMTETNQSPHPAKWTPLINEKDINDSERVISVSRSVQVVPYIDWHKGESCYMIVPRLISESAKHKPSSPLGLQPCARRTNYYPSSLSASSHSTAPPLTNLLGKSLSSTESFSDAEASTPVIWLVCRLVFQIYTALVSLDRQRASIETCDLSDFWSDWCGSLTWPTKNLPSYLPIYPP